jgi:hypothetical protein
MSEYYQITSEGDITHITFLTTATFQEMTNVVNDLVGYSPLNKRLWNFAAGLDMSSLQIQTVAEYISEKLPQKAKAAVVAPDGLSFGLSRMLEARRTRLHTSTLIFRTMDEAMSWLNSED